MSRKNDTHNVAVVTAGKKFGILLILLGAIGCDAITGEEVARMPIKQISNKELVIKEVTLYLKKGEELAFWTEMDLEYENDLALVYVVEVWRDSRKEGGFELNALKTNPTMMQVKTTFAGKTSWSYTGRMNSLDIEEDGTYTFKAILQSSDNPTLLLNQADLIFKK